jgi:hypothetical protein
MAARGGGARVLEQAQRAWNPFWAAEGGDAHPMWWPKAAHVSGRELTVADRRSGGGRSLSRRRGVRHTGGA